MCTLCNPERDQRDPGCAGQESAYRITYPAGAAIPSGAINPLSAKIISYYKPYMSTLPTSGVSTTGLLSDDYAKEVPFTDNADKGDLRLDYQQSANSSWFLRISDRKETGVNYPVIPLPLDSTANGTIRILDQQVALGYTHLFGANKVLDARLGLSAPRPGSIRSRSARTSSQFRACKPCPLQSLVACHRCPSPTSPPLDARAPTHNGRIRRCSIPR